MHSHQNKESKKSIKNNTLRKNCSEVCSLNDKMYTEIVDHNSQIKYADKIDKFNSFSQLLAVQYHSQEEKKKWPS